MKIIVEYDVEVEGKCNPEEELLKHLGRAGTPGSGKFVILANSIEIKHNYEELQTENKMLKKERREWKCVGCGETIYPHDYCDRCRRNLES